DPKTRGIEYSAWRVFVATFHIYHRLRAATVRERSPATTADRSLIVTARIADLIHSPGQLLAPVRHQIHLRVRGILNELHHHEAAAGPHGIDRLVVALENNLGLRNGFVFRLPARRHHRVAVAIEERPSVARPVGTL